MKAEFINPFIESTFVVFKTMLGLDPEKEKIYLKEGDKPTYDVSGVIGLAGDVIGSVVLSFPEELVFLMVENFLGEAKETVDDEVIDAIGEFVNIIAGNTKKYFVEKENLRFKISIPSVIVGKNHKINMPSNIKFLGVKFKLGAHRFALEVAMQEQ